MNLSLFERLGGKSTLEKVHKIFYDKIFEDDWMKNFFTDVEQSHIENQQTDFMTIMMGGPKNAFSGRMPAFAHEHVYIDEELYMYRHNILIESIEEAGVAKAEKEEWLALDLSFKRALIKKDLSQCNKRFTTDEVLYFKNPKKFKKVG